MEPLRLAVPDDIPALAALIAAAFEGYRGKLTPPSSSLNKTPEAVHQELASANAFVAEDEGRLVGCVFFQLEGDAYYVSRFAVHPDYRGKGIGSTLIQVVEHTALEYGVGELCLSVRLALKNLRRYYEKTGFELVGYGSHAGYTEPTFAELRKRL